MKNYQVTVTIDFWLEADSRLEARDKVAELVRPLEEDKGGAIYSVEAKASSRTMDDIAQSAIQEEKRVRAKLIRLCPYVGPHIPDIVKKKAELLWPAPYNPQQSASWQWDRGSGSYQWELDVCDLDQEDDLIEPAGYVAIRPLKGGKFALLVSALGVHIDDPEAFSFDSIEEAKSYLDGLLAIDSPEIF